MNSGHKEYDEAFERYRTAFKMFGEVRQGYRAGTMSGEQYETARRIFETAHNALDEIEGRMLKGRM